MFARLGTAAAAAALTALLIPAAHAMDETIVEANVVRTTANISYADLNLAKAADVAELQARVRRAATNICIDRGTRDLARTMNGLECRSTAIENAKPQIALAVANANNQQLAENRTISVAMP